MLERFRIKLGMIAVGVCALPAAAQGQGTATLSGRITVVEKDDNVARDVGTSVVWLDAVRAGPMIPDTIDIITADKEFRPSVTVVPIGSTVRFPNSDPFDHNVFSLTEHVPFDLGLYGRGEARATKFNRPGLVRIYCNVHPKMTATVIVRDNPYFAQPAGDGSFVIEDVPSGSYTLRAWHVRAAEYSQQIEVSAAGINVVNLELDASRYRFAQHRNKYGRPYRRGRRY